MSINFNNFKSETRETTDKILLIEYCIESRTSYYYIRYLSVNRIQIPPYWGYTGTLEFSASCITEQHWTDVCCALIHSYGVRNSLERMS